MAPRPQLPARAQARPVPPYAKNPVYHQQPVAPIHLSSAVQLPTGTSGGVSVATLKNPMGQDMEILEIKFEVVGPLDTDSEVASAYGGSIGCELVMGNYKLTNGSIPVWCFGRAENLSAESKTDLYGSTAGLSYNAYTWRLPRPLFVPAGAVIQPKFNHFGYVPQTLTTRIGYSGRSVFKSPRAAYVPWVAAYMSKVFNPITAATTDVSSTRDLINDTDKVFHLQRFVGRTLFTSQDDLHSEAAPSPFGSRYLTMRMVDSYGRPIVRTYTPFRSVFGAPTRSWELEEIGAQLDPGAFYQVFLKKAAMTMAANQDAGQIQAFVSMVGWREERT
jgi:hypothetical protein